jgi:ABC-type multidrug transport system ATPase subunit
VFIIAHRLSTVRQCDRIIVMEKGKIIESGSHDELITLNDYYAKLHSYQNHTPNIKTVKNNGAVNRANLSGGNTALTNGLPKGVTIQRGSNRSSAVKVVRQTVQPEQPQQIPEQQASEQSVQSQNKPVIESTVHDLNESNDDGVDESWAHELLAELERDDAVSSDDKGPE